MKIFIYVVISLFFLACSPIYTHHKASVITFKTPQLSFSDAGFIHDDGVSIKVVILVVGQPAFTLEVGRKVCLDGQCFSKRKFIKEKLNALYPENLLQDIFLQKPIFNADNVQIVEGGFKQKFFKEEVYDISYSVIDGKMRFKDKISKILIKSKKI